MPAWRRTALSEYPEFLLGVTKTETEVPFTEIVGQKMLKSTNVVIAISAYFISQKIARRT